MHGTCMACAWRVHGTPCTWRVHGMCIAYAWCAHTTRHAGAARRGARRECATDGQAAARPQPALSARFAPVACLSTSLPKHVDSRPTYNRPTAWSCICRRAAALEARGSARRGDRHRARARAAQRDRGASSCGRWSRRPRPVPCADARGLARQAHAREAWPHETKGLARRSPCDRPPLRRLMCLLGAA